VDIVDVIATVQRELDNTLPSSSGQASINPDIEQTLERVVDAKGGNFLATGFSKLDRHASLRPGNLTLIAADPGAGKTSYLLCAARHMAKHGKRPLIFTLEMTREQILENLIAQELKICHQDMVNGALNDNQVNMMMRRIGDFRRMNIGLVDKKMCGASIGKIRHRSIIEARTNGVDCIMIDSLTKVKMPENAGKYVTRLADVYNLICGDLVDLAEELNVPVVITHHLNKDGSKRGNKNKPTIQSLREAGDMWTHNVVLIYRQYLHTKDKADENKAEFIVAKARDGRVGAVEAWFDGPTKTFGELSEGG
jgi:replicative DNA helicase